MIYSGQTIIKKDSTLSPFALNLFFIAVQRPGFSIVKLKKILPDKITNEMPCKLNGNDSNQILCILQKKIPITYYDGNPLK